MAYPRHFYFSFVAPFCVATSTRMKHKINCTNVIFRRKAREKRAKNVKLKRFFPISCRLWIFVDDTRCPRDHSRSSTALVHRLFSSSSLSPFVSKRSRLENWWSNYFPFLELYEMFRFTFNGWVSLCVASAPAESLRLFLSLFHTAACF